MGVYFGNKNILPAEGAGSFSGVTVNNIRYPQPLDDIRMMPGDNLEYSLTYSSRNFATFSTPTGYTSGGANGKYSIRVAADGDDIDGTLESGNTYKSTLLELNATDVDDNDVPLRQHGGQLQSIFWNRAFGGYNSTAREVAIRNQKLFITVDGVEYEFNSTNSPGGSLSDWNRGGGTYNDTVQAYGYSMLGAIPTQSSTSNHGGGGVNPIAGKFPQSRVSTVDYRTYFGLHEFTDPAEWNAYSLPWIRWTTDLKIEYERYVGFTAGWGQTFYIQTYDFPDRLT